MTTHSRCLGLVLAAAVCLTSTESAFGHAGHPHPHDNAWASGLLHPLLGLDHLLAMLASGLLAVRIGTRRALWLIPASFVGLMLFGGALAALGLALPPAEWGITLSVIVLALAVAMLPPLPLGLAATLVALFAVCHGHAHVAEAASHALLPYIIGFTAATLGLHAAAIGIGLTAQRLAWPHLVRLAGAGIAASFVVLLLVG